MDQLGLVTFTGPTTKEPSIFEEGSLAADCGIEYVYDGKLIPESKVFGTDSQKGN
jgi:hypothetical protein